MVAFELIRDLVPYDIDAMTNLAKCRRNVNHSFEKADLTSNAFIKRISDPIEPNTKSHQDL
jgi:hypothetical protein